MNSTETSDSNKKRKLSLSAFVTLIARVVNLVYKSSPYLLMFQGLVVILNSLMPFVNRYVTGRIFDEIIAAVSNTSDISQNILNLIFIYILLTFFSSVVSYSKNIVDTNMREIIRYAVEKVVTSKFAFLDIEYHENPKMNDLLQRSSRSYHRPIQFYFDLLRIFAGLIGVVTSFYLLYTLNPLIVLVLAVSVFPEAINNAVFGRKVWDLFRDKSEDIRDFSMTRRHLLSDKSLKEVRIFGLQSYLHKRAFDSYERYFNNWIKLRNKREYINMGLGLLSNVGFAYVFYILIKHTFDQTITVGLLTFYIGTANSFASSIKDIFNSSTQLYEEGLYVADIYELLDLPRIIVPGELKITTQDNPPKIEFRNVSFKYPETDITVLKNINLTIDPGEHLAFVGENGAGKTTLIKLLMRFYDVSEGEILVDGISIRELDLDDWYSRIASLFQDYNFYHFTAFENIAIGDIKDIENRERAISAAQKSGAHEFIEKYENKYDQILSKSFSTGINPSEGQKQRVALARAFFKNSPVLIMDEPTSAIDPKAEYEIFQELMSFAQKKTLLIVSHRFSTVRNADRIVVLSEGSIIEEGTHDDLMNISEGVYKHAFDLQKRGYT